MHFTEKVVIMELLHRCNHLRTFKQIHAQLLTSSGVLRDDLIVNKAVAFFGKSADFASYACEFLTNFPRGLCSFPLNTLLSSYASCDRPQTAIRVYRRMVRNGFRPDTYTFPAILKSCAKFTGRGEGKQIHVLVIKSGFKDDIYVLNSLVHFYSVCGDFELACKLFDEMSERDVVSWTGIISGFVRAGLFKEALEWFLKMDIRPNNATFVGVLIASGRQGCLSLGKGIHGSMLKQVFPMCLEVSNSLMDMYVKCEALYDAKKVFNEMEEKDIVSWTSIISGLVQCERPKEAIELFAEMQTAGVRADGIILTSVLSACASLGALDYGRWVHEYITRSGIKWDIHIGTAIIDMYAKCGCIDTALRIFNELKDKKVSTWNALLGGLAVHGHGREALEQFNEMVRVGTKPNNVTFLAVLSACCHSGLVDEGRGFFYKMTDNEFNISPRLEHFGCMVDLLCKAGRLDDALEMIKAMPMKPDVRVCGAILGACKARGNLELPKEILDLLLEMEFQDSGVYVLLSNIYAANKRWGDVVRVRKLMKEKGISKNPGSSVVDLHGETFGFVVGDTVRRHN